MFQHANCFDNQFGRPVLTEWENYGATISGSDILT